MGEDGVATQAATNAFIRELWGLQAAGYATLILRYLTHFIFGRPFDWDDLIIALATVSPSPFRVEFFAPRSRVGPHPACLHRRIRGGVLHGSPLAGAREQWHDAGAEGGPPTERSRVAAAGQRLQDARGRSDLLHDRSVAAQGLLGCLLHTNDVRLSPLPQTLLHGVGCPSLARGK